jgi:hypothetical protein
MARRMRHLRYVVVALCVAAQSAFTVPARVPEPPVAAERAPADSAPADIAPGAPHVADGGNALRGDAGGRDALAPLFAVDAGGRGGGRDTRVAEPNTLVLVSVGLFALILWSRRRR